MYIIIPRVSRIERRTEKATLRQEGEPGKLTPRTAAEIRGQNGRPQGKQAGRTQEQEGKAEQSREKENDARGQEETGEGKQIIFQ